MVEYYMRILELEEHCGRIAVQMEQIAQEERYAEPVKQLKAFKGIETLIALSLVVEIGDFRRFATAAQFMAFLGLVPSERSSGGKRRQGGITKSGNSHLRKLLVEAAWHYRGYHPGSKRLAKRREGLPARLITYANKAGRRLNKKYLRMLFSGKKSQIAVTAVARELSGFIWGTMVRILVQFCKADVHLILVMRRRQAPDDSISLRYPIRVYQSGLSSSNPSSAVPFVYRHLSSLKKKEKKYKN